MADLAATDVTVTVQAAQPHNPRIVGTKRRCVVKIVFGDGALTYPDGGVPMPTFASFGLVRNIEDLLILDASGSGYDVKYDRTNNKIRLYNPGAELTAAVDAPAAQTYYAEAVGW